MSWPVIALLALVVLLALLAFPGARAQWRPVATALLLGLAGYALQGSPALPGAPKARAEAIDEHPEAQVEARQKLAARDNQGDAALTMADAFMRHGQYADAAGILSGAVEKNPNNGQAWLVMANALVFHAEGALSPSALYAYRRAAAADPNAPGPPFFLGMALAQNGRLQEARTLWSSLLARAPADARWKPDLERRLQMLDEFIARQSPMPALMAPQ